MALYFWRVPVQVRFFHSQRMQNSMYFITLPPIPFFSLYSFFAIPAFAWSHSPNSRYIACFLAVHRNLHTFCHWQHVPQPAVPVLFVCAPFPISPAAFARRRRKIQRCIYRQTMSRTLHRPFSRFLCPALAVGPGVPCGRLFYPVFHLCGIFPVYPLG